MITDLDNSVGVKGDHNHGDYKIEYKGRTVVDNRALVCQYGKASRHFRIADVSNGDFEEVGRNVSYIYRLLLILIVQTEFLRFNMTNQGDRVTPPKRSDLSRKHDSIKELRERPMTDVGLILLSLVQNSSHSITGRSQSSSSIQTKNQPSRSKTT